MYTLADLRYQAQRRTLEELLAHLKSFSLEQSARYLAQLDS